MTFAALLQKLLDKKDLASTEMHAAMQSIMQGEYTAVQMGTFLIALRAKGESIEEITVAAEVMRSLMRPVKSDLPLLVDTCGTGGDGAQTFNVSTAAAIVAASAGVTIAKHGGRSVSSHSGSSDVLEALGIKLEADPLRITQSLAENGISFMFAPHFHPAMKVIAPIRRELGVRTIFNLLGPLANPAGVKHQVLGVFSKDLVEPIAHVLKQLGSQHVLVLHAELGLDEASLQGLTYVAELKNGEVQTYTVSAEDFGLVSQSMQSCTVMDSMQSKDIILQSLQDHAGAARDLIALNAGAAIYVGAKAPTWKAGVALALDMLQSGKAQQKLDQLVHWNFLESADHVR